MPTMKLTVRQTSLPDVVVVEHEVFEDDRGFFMEVYRSDEFASVRGEQIGRASCRERV